MFLNIDTQEKTRVALIDNENHEITYGELAEKIKEAGAKVESRSIIFNLCKNTVGAMIGYLGFINNEAVPLNLSDKIDKELLNTLIATYTPAYLWVPEEEAGSYGYETVYNTYGYTLLKTGNEIYPIHNELQFLMTTSGSTGSPKLVRYKKGEEPSLSLNLPMVSAVMQAVSGDRLAVALAQEGGVSFLYGSQNCGIMAGQDV